MRDIIPPRSPTQAPMSNRSSITLSSDTDADTESIEVIRPRKESEAARYLRQFQSSASLAAEGQSSRSSRPRYHRASASVTATTTSAAPSLSHTPASLASLASIPYTPSSNRPLLPRKNPYSTSAGARSIELVTPFTKLPTEPPPSITPYSLKSTPSSSTTISIAEGQMLYQKKTSLTTPLPGHGSLKELFAGSTPTPSQPF
jgi:hypothetical protein